MGEESLFADVDRGSLLHPPEVIADYVQRLAQQIKTSPVHERRSVSRHRVAIPVVIQPLDDQCQRTGKPFRAIVRDISSRGIGLLHDHAIDAKFLALEMSLPGSPAEQEIRVMMQVLRCRPIGETMYDIGGTFVTKLNAPSS